MRFCVRLSFLATPETTKIREKASSKMVNVENEPL